jgi:hypothetical protein
MSFRLSTEWLPVIETLDGPGDVVREGEAEIAISGKPPRTRAGEVIPMPANRIAGGP